VAGSAKSKLEKAALKTGLTILPSNSKPKNLIKVNALKIALFDMYGGLMPSGWIRWMLEQYHFNATVIYPQDVDKGGLKEKYDVIIFPDGGIPALAAGNSPMRGGNIKPEEVPEMYRNRIGRISADKSIPQLKQFLDAGGQLVAIGSSTNVAYHLSLPVRDARVELAADGKERKLPEEKYYVPGSVLRVNYDRSKPANWGMEESGDIYFDNSPVFKITTEAVSSGRVKPLAWFGTAKPLRSGWAWGQAYLQDGVVAFEAPVGQGKLVAFGPEITFRAQTHGTFKLLFNQLYGQK
jgi:hypothetical protein